MDTIFDSEKTCEDVSREKILKKSREKNNIMTDLNHYIDIYKEKLTQGDIQKAYVGLLKFVTKLRTNLSGKLSGNYSFGSLFQGYMDYTYFYYSNNFLKKRKLKMGLVLNHSKMQFEIWLLGQTIPIQEKYWQYFKTTKWNKDRITKPQYAILETVIIDKPDFNDPEKLTKQIEDQLIRISDEIIQNIQNSKLT